MTNPGLRRLELSWGGYYVGDWAYVIALSVFAYRHGGSLAVGVVGLLRMGPAALAVPFAALISDRFPRHRVLTLVHITRAFALAFAALLSVISAYLAARVGAAGARTRRPGGSVLSNALAGFRALAADPHPRVLIGLFIAQTFVRGLLNVLIVVTALKLLNLGGSGVGVLNAGFGVGGLIGAFAALSLVARRRLAYPFAGGLLLWGLPIALIGVWPHEWVALGALALVGIGNSVLDVAGFTLVQRIVDDALLARVFGVLETGSYAGVGVGAIAATALVALLGIRGALVATGSILPALAFIFWRALGRINDRVVVPQ